MRELRIGAGQTCADHVLPPYLEELVARHPKTEIRVTTGTGREMLKRLRDGELCIAAGALDITPEDLTFHPMHESEVVVITPKDHPLANRASVTAEEIAGEQFVAHTAHQEARKVLDAILRWRHDIKADVRAEIDTWNAITGWVAAGAGIAIVPEISVRDDARVGKARLEGGMPTRIYGAITRRNVRLSLSARRFLEVVHERTGAPAGTPQGMKGHQRRGPSPTRRGKCGPGERTPQAADIAGEARASLARACPRTRAKRTLGT